MFERCHGKRDLGKERDFLLSKREKIHEGRPRKHATLTSTASTYSYSSLLFSSLVVLIDDKNDEEEERFLLLCQGAINAAALRLPLRFVSSFVSSSRNVYLGCCTKKSSCPLIGENADITKGNDEEITSESSTKPSVHRAEVIFFRAMARVRFVRQPLTLSSCPGYH